MEIYLENIQGFKGKFHYSLDSNINVITAKHNGTGKTTFFECLKLLCCKNLFTKEDLEFFVNKDCNWGQFCIYIRELGIAYGFECTKKKVIYYRMFDDEDGVEKNSEPFPEAERDLNVFIKGNSIINICDRFIDLFSSSNEKLNYTLMRDLTSHQGIDEMINRAEDSLHIHQEHLKIQMQELKFINRELTNTKYFKNIETLESILNQDGFIQIHDNLVDSFIYISSLYPEAQSIILLPLEIWIQLYNLTLQVQLETSEVKLIKTEEFYDVYNSMQQVQSHSKCITELPILHFNECYNILSNIAEGISVINLTSLEILLDIYESFRKITLLTNTKLLMLMVCNLEIFNNIVPANKINKKSLLSTFTDIYYTLTNCYENIELIEHSKQEVNLIKNQLQSFTQDCPLYEKVYIVDGECIHV